MCVVSLAFYCRTCRSVGFLSVFLEARPCTATEVSNREVSSGEGRGREGRGEEERGGERKRGEGRGREGRGEEHTISHLGGRLKVNHSSFKCDLTLRNIFTVSSDS